MRKVMKKAMLCLLWLMLVLPVCAQTPRRRPATAPPQSAAPSRPPRKLVETIKTPDGRDVHLYDDMTYDVAVSVAPPAPTSIDLRIKAGVITRGGDVKAVARTQFIVFNEDIKPALATVTSREGKALDVFGFYMADEYRVLDNGRAYTAAMEKLKPNIVGTFTTDFEGNGSVQVPPSDKPYYIYGSFKVGRSSCMWYLQITPDKSGNLTLDNNNAAYCG